MLALKAGITFFYVPYATSAASQASVVSGDTSVMITGVSSSLAFIRSGKLRALGVSGATPVSSLPNVPPIVDTAPGYEADNWAGFLVPANTPSAVVTKLHDAIVQILKMPDVQQRLDFLGLRAVGGTPE